MRTLLAAAAALVLVPSIPAGAQPAPPRQERVAFAKGASSATSRASSRATPTSTTSWAPLPARPSASR